MTFKRRLVLGATSLVALTLLVAPVLAFADETSDLDLEKKRLDNETTRIANDKAKVDLAKAKSDAATARLAVPASGYTGSVTAGDGAGLAEESALSIAALDQIAGEIQNAVANSCAGDRQETPLQRPKTALEALADPPGVKSAPSLPKTSAKALVVVYVGDDHPSTKDKQVFDLTIERFKRAFDEVNPSLRPGQRVELLDLATIGAVVSGVNNLLGYFKTDYEVRGATLDADSAELANLLVNHLASADIDSVYLASELDPQLDAQVLKALKDLRDLADKASTKAKAYRADQAKLKKGDKRIDELETKASAIEKVVTDFKAFDTAMQTTDDKGDTPIVKISRETLLAAQPNLCNVQVKVNKAAGSSYTKKNIFTAFDNMAFYVSATVNASYRVWGADNRLRTAGVLTRHTDYTPVDRLGISDGGIKTIAKRDQGSAGAPETGVKSPATSGGR